MTALPFRSDAEIATAIPVVENHLARGGLLAYPTETVYGLGSRPLDDDVARLASLKGRKPGKPFLLLVAGLGMVDACGLRLTAAARAIADRFWPGPITLVLGGGEGRLPELLRGPEGGIAVRWTSHAGIARLLATLDTPITSTSANQPGGPTAPGVAALLATFGGAVDDGTLLILDGGVLGNRPPSTVVDCTTDRPRVIRQGAVPVSDLRGSLGSLAP